MQIISFLDANDIIQTAILEGTQYRIRMLYNDGGGFWTLSLFNAANQPLIEGIKIVPDYPLLMPYHAPGIPPGELIITTLGSQLQVIGRNDFSQGRAILGYVTEEEVNAIRAV